VLKVKYKYSNKEFIIQPYSTAIEKDLLLLSTVGENDLNLALSICGIDDYCIDTLSYYEKKAFLLKLREISIGSSVEVKFKCAKCNNSNENSIDIDDIIIEPTNNDSRITDQYKELNDSNISDFINVNDIEEMDYDEYQELMLSVDNSICKFDFRKPVQCQKCSHENHINILSDEFILSILSEDTLISLYQTYNDLIFFGKYSKHDIDTMYPFERTIFVSLLNKSREELNK